MKYIIANNYLCFYAILEMILLDCGCSKFTQFSLANKFGVVLPNGYVIERVENVIYSDNTREQGAHIHERILNDFFERTNIPLYVSYASCGPFFDFNKYLDIDQGEQSHSSKENYYIYTFSYGSLYHEVQNLSVGHVSLFIDCPSHDNISIYDPGPRNPGLKTVSKIALYDAMEDIAGGVYLISKK